MVSSRLPSKNVPEERKLLGLKPSRRTGLAVTALLLLAGALAACSTAQPASSSPSTSSTPTALPGQTGSTATPSGGTATPAPTATPFAGAFQVVFADQYTAATCSGTHPIGTICVTTSGTGQETGLGTISLSRTSIDAAGGADSCGPATTQGALTLAAGDIVTFTGTGTFCRATQVADFTYKITGGTRNYLHATGSGTIQVPRPTSSTTGTETWTGTLHA
jgi:hypothetical protein